MNGNGRLLAGLLLVGLAIAAIVATILLVLQVRHG